MRKEARDYLELQRRIATFKYAAEWGNVAKACRAFCVPRASYYKWKKAYDAEGEAGLVRKRPIARTNPRAIPQETVDKVLELRTAYHHGPQRIVWYMERYHGIRIAFSSVYRILVRHVVNRFPTRVGCRALHTCRYAKEVPGHHVQVDVKILTLQGQAGKSVRRFQYTAIDDATRIRALQIYPSHNQANAISFIDYVLEKFPFRIQTIRTDRGHEFQALFHWHVEDKGIRHIYIKPRSPELNGKVERSHRSDGEEFYQLLSYTDDVDLNRKLAEWEHFYNFDRPHGAHGGRTPYEALRSMLEHAK
jgi:transposase InsO family protein